jgi:hypothetical protein
MVAGEWRAEEGKAYAHIRQHMTARADIMSAVPRASKEVVGRAIAVMRSSLGEGYAMCQLGHFAT